MSQSYLESLSLAHRLPAAATALALGLLVGWQLLVPPVVGLANNGDFYRIAPQVGAYYINPDGPETIDPNAPGYVSRHYRTAEPRNPQGYYSSGVTLMWLARGLNDLVRRDGLFDIRFLGAVHLGALIAAVSILLGALVRHHAAVRWTAAALACLMLSDVGYFSFFHSFYSESATLIFLVLWVASVFLLPGREAALGPPTPRDGFFLASGVLFLTAKPQNAVLAPLLVALWWSLRWPARGKSDRRTVLALVAAGSGLCAFALLYLAARPFQEVNRYNHVFEGILGQDPDAAEHLRAFGLGDEYAQLIGTHWWSPLSPAQEKLKWSTAGKLKTMDIVRYYGRNPERFAALFARGARAAFVFRPKGLGNFEQSRGGPPGEMSSRLAHWTGIKQAVLPSTALGLIGAGFAMAVLWLLLTRTGDAETSKPARFGLCLWAMAATQLFAVLIGGGEVELVRHLFLFNALVDLSLIVLVVAVGARLLTGAGVAPTSLPPPAHMVDERR